MSRPSHLVCRNPAARAVALALLLVLLGFCGPASAATRTVTSLYDFGTGSLRNTITAADPGDTIIFDAGLSGTVIMSGGPYSITKDLTIDGDGRITISGDNLSRIFYVQDASLTLTRLVLTNGDPTEEVIGVDSGGAIYFSVENGSENLTLTDCTITGNAGVWSAGGAVYATKTSAATSVNISATNCRFTDNSQSGLSFNPQSPNSGTASVTLDGCRFQNNVANGCNISFHQMDVTVTVTDSLFDNNGVNGGVTRGLAITAWSGPVAATVTGCTFSNNRGGNSAPGLAFTTWNDLSTIDVKKCRIIGNLNTSYTTGGAQLSCYMGASAVVENCFFSGNESTSGRGGGLSVLTGTGMIRVRNNTIAANTALEGGAGMYIMLEDNTAIAYLDNNIVYGNTLSGTGVGKDIYIADDYDHEESDGIGAATYVRYSIFGAGTQDVYADVGDNLTLDAYLTQDPMLRNTSTGDLHLRANSPAIDAGRCAYLVDLGGFPYFDRIAPSDDIDGDSRPTGLTTFFGCDIGADEYTARALPVIMLLDE